MPWSEAALAGPTALVVATIAASKVSALGSGWAIAHARRNGLLDQPGERRSHAVPTPRGGGIGIAAAGVLALLLVAATAALPHAWLMVAGGLSLVSAVGWWDDHWPLSPWTRLCVHALAAGCLAWSIRLQGGSPLAVAAAFAAALVLVNAWNFMDGIDGLATTQALLCALGFAVVLGHGWRLLALVVAGGCLGFLPFNLPRAKLFLGDVGSGALGFLVAALLAAAFTARPPVAWPLLLLAPMAMLVDTGLTLAWRICRRERWWQPHVQHAFQRWSRHRGHARVCLAYAVWTFAAVALMLVALHGPAPRALGVALASLLASAGAWGWLHRRYDKNHTEGFGT
jgi:UDP-N-acetylmuramyl pentapeptide phosphotransferase/UDP-N-acetylglucosamine-1-phosphate transferase